MRTQSLLLHQVISRLVVVSFCAAVLALMPMVSRAASVSPSVIELSGGRGETIGSTITLINTDTAEQTYYLDTIAFTAREEGGSPEFIPNDGQEGLLQWIWFNSDVVVVPGRSSGEVVLSITIPDSVESGGYYAAVTVSSAPEDVIATNGAIVEAKTAVLVLLTVEGETNQSAAILDFVDSNSSTVRSTFDGEFVYRIQNQGNVHVTPQGWIRFYDFFGRTVWIEDANVTEGRVLPGSTRSYTVEVDQSLEGWMETISWQMRTFAMGPISVGLELNYGADQKSLEAELSFVYIPWQLLLSIFIVVMLMKSIYRLGRKKVRK